MLTSAKIPKSERYVNFGDSSHRSFVTGKYVSKREIQYRHQPQRPVQNTFPYPQWSKTDRYGGGANFCQRQAKLYECLCERNRKVLWVSADRQSAQDSSRETSASKRVWKLPRASPYHFRHTGYPKDIPRYPCNGLPMYRAVRGLTAKTIWIHQKVLRS